LKDEDITTYWTLLVTVGNNGIAYSQGKGTIYLEDKELASYTMSSITKPNNPDIASSRGITRIRCSSSYGNPEISSLLDGMAAVYELEQDNDGNYSARFWEWK
jgi:hypothetical protein